MAMGVLGKSFFINQMLFYYGERTATDWHIDGHACDRLSRGKSDFMQRIKANA